MRIKGIHHVTVAVRDIEEARATFEELLGAGGDGSESAASVVEPFRVRTRDLHIGDGTLQIVSPLDADNPVMRFLERKGEGFYNIALEVDDLDAAVRELAERGVRVSDPVATAPSVRSAFITMAATHGISIQLVEVASEAEAVGATDDPKGTDVVAGDSAPAPEAPPADAETAQQPLDLTPDEWSDVD
jgi:methylmalonyl-CoA epimerase